MRAELVENLVEKIEGLQPAHIVGRVSATGGGRILVDGLQSVASIGDRAQISLSSGDSILGEVVQMDGDKTTVIADGSVSGLSIGAEVKRLPPLSVSPCVAWLGRTIDANGHPLDDRPLQTGRTRKPLANNPPPASGRQGFGQRLKTGSFALNTLLPLVEGQRIGLFAGSGVGKSTLLATMIKSIDVDVIVLALVGERGREVRHFTQSVLGAEGMKKCVVVAATAEKSAIERRRCAYTAMSVAEHFRDSGKSVLYVADSITRLAEAHREVATQAGEMPVLRGHPPSAAHVITSLCERAGPGTRKGGHITAVLSVLVQGSDMEEPVADILRGVLDGHVVLNREIAERGRYPAIDLLQSVSRCLPDAATQEENEIITRVRYLTSLYEQNAMMIRSGLYNQGSDPELDIAIKAWPEIDAFIGKCSDAAPEHCFDKLRLILRRIAKR